MAEPDPIVGMEPPAGATPLPGQGIGTLPSRLGELPSANVTGFCTINSRGIGSLDLLDLNSTIVINLLVFVFLLLVFERCRHIKSVYFPRYEWLSHRKPPELPRGFLAWVRPLMSIPEEKILQLAGLDGYMLLRYIRLCLKICVASGFFGLVVLVPLYLHGNRAKPYDGNFRSILRDPKLISMGNIKDEAYLWVPVCFAYFTTLHTLYLLKREYKRFLTLRLTYMSVGDPDVNVQKSFSIMVDRIPYEFRSNAALYALFSEIFPGDVHSAVVALRIDGLEALVARRAQVLSSLESAVATRQVTGKEPTLFLPEGGKWWNRLRCKGQRVEAIPYWQGELDKLNAAITQMQAATRMDADAINEKEEKRQESRRQLLQHNPADPTSVGGGRRLSVSPFLLGDAKSRLNLMGKAGLVEEVTSLGGTTQLADTQGLAVSVDAEAGDSSGGVPLPGFLHTQPQRRPAHPPAAPGRAASVTSVSGNGGEGPFEEPALSVAAHGVHGGSSSSSSRSVVAEEAGAARYTSFEEVEQAGRGAPRGCRKQGVGAKACELLQRALHFGKQTGQEVLEAGQEVTKAVGLLAVDSSTMSSTGFVTFKSMSSAAVASQSLLTMEPFMFTITPAPEPRDIAFNNVSTALRLVEWREATTTLLFVFLSIFWGGLVSALYNFQSWLQRQSNEEPALQELGTWGRFLLYLGIDYVPTLILLIIMALLPLFFWWSANNYEKMRTYSDMDAAVMSRYFYYQMVNIYATIVGGALLDEVMAIAKDPRVAVRVLGCQMPVVAVYFMQIIVTKALSALMWEFSRAWPLIRQAFTHWFIDYDRITHRQRRSSLLYKPSMYYGWTYPSLLLVLTICLTYAQAMPVTVLLGVVYFFLVEILYTYHLLYVYSPQYESGGKMFYNVFDRTLVALLLSHLTLIGYVAVLGASKLVPVLVPLPIFLIPFYRHCQNGYHEASLKLSLLAARRIDTSLREEEELEEDEEEEGDDGTGGGATNVVVAAVGSPEKTNGGSGNGNGSDIGRGGSSQRTSSSRSSSLRGSPGGRGRGLGKRRRSTTRVGEGATPAPMDARGGANASFLEAALLVHEPLIFADYFEMSAYAQPSLTEAPQEAENLPSRAGSPSEGPVPNCAMAPSSSTVSPRPISLSASAHAALAKRLGRNPALAEDMVEEALSALSQSSGGGGGGGRGSGGDQRV